ncbi:MAG TPA: carbohydrate ABC transporter permease [Trueperaceae bacterium]
MALAEAAAPGGTTEESRAVETRGRRVGRLVGRGVFLALLSACTVVFLAPFAWLVSASLKSRSEVFNSEWIPDPVMWSNYLNVWRAAPVFSWLQNSVIVGLVGALAVTVSSAAVAFGFSYFRFRGRDALFGLVLATMMLPGAVTMIPVYLIWNRLGMVNTLVPLWAGNLFGSAFYIFLLRQFYLGLPRDLFDAARIDGANYLQMWWRVALPLTRTALIVVFIFEFKALWTDLLKPLIYLYDTALFTMPRGIKTLIDRFGQGGEMQWELVLAATTILTVPLIVLFFFGQRYFIEGIATTGAKG